MKYVYLFTLILSTFSLIGQVTIDNSIFPSIGSEIKYHIYNEEIPFSSLDVIGGPYTWTFNQPSTIESTNIVRFSDPKQNSFSSEFPSSNLLMTNDVGDIVFLNKTATEIRVIGSVFESDFGALDTLALPAKSKELIYKAPLKLGTDISSTGSYAIAFGSDIIPDTILASLPIPIDSIRIKLDSENDGRIEAMGTLEVNNQSHQVLMGKIQTIFSPNLEFKVGFLGWVNPAILGLPLPDGFSFFGIKDTSIVYRFYENNHVGSLLEVSFSVQDGEPTFIETSVNSDILNSAFNYTSDTESPWTIFPNPTFSNDITMAALKPNHDIVIHISDIKGRLIHTQEIANCNGSEVISVPNLSGLYTIKILDKTDKTLSSKKFLKL